MAVLTFCITGNAFGAPRLQPEGGPAIALTPVKPVDAATLTAGLRFVCF